MKSLFAASMLALSSLVTSAAVACPDLSGTFICDGQPLTVTQTVEDGFPVYSFNNGDVTMKADGVTRTVPVGRAELPFVEETNSCYTDPESGISSLNNLAKGDLFSGGVKTGVMAVTTVFLIDPNGNLFSMHNGNAVMDDGQITPFQGEISCTRK